MFLICPKVSQRLPRTLHGPDLVVVAVLDDVIVHLASAEDETFHFLRRYDVVGEALVDHSATDRLQLVAELPGSSHLRNGIPGTNSWMSDTHCG